MKLRRFAALFSSIVENKIKLESGGATGEQWSRVRLRHIHDPKTMVFLEIITSPYLEI